MGCSLSSNSHFQMGVTVMGSAGHFGLGLLLMVRVKTHLGTLCQANLVFKQQPQLARAREAMLRWVPASFAYNASR